MNEKIIKSAWIALGGAAVTVLPLLTVEVSDWILTGDVIDWRTPLAMVITAIGTWAVNTIRVYIKTE